MNYRQFVQVNFHKAQGQTPQDKMRNLGEMWKTEKTRGSGLYDLFKKELPHELWSTVGEFSDQRVPEYLEKKLRELDRKKTTAEFVSYRDLTGSGPYHAEVARFDTLVAPNDVRDRVFGWLGVDRAGSLPRHVRRMLTTYTGRYEIEKKRRDQLKTAADDYDQHMEEGGGVGGSIPPRKPEPAAAATVQPRTPLDIQANVPEFIKEMNAYYRRVKTLLQKSETAPSSSVQREADSLRHIVALQFPRIPENDEKSRQYMKGLKSMVNDFFTISNNVARWNIRQEMLQHGSGVRKGKKV